MTLWRFDARTAVMIDLRDLMDDDSERLFDWRKEREVDRWMSDLPLECL